MLLKCSPAGKLIFNNNFPKSISNFFQYSRHLLAAGGGGSAKTGVANGFAIFELFHNGQHYVAEEIQRCETQVIMNMACSIKSVDKRSILVIGQEGNSQMFVITTKIGQLPAKEPVGRRESTSETRQRKNRERADLAGPDMYRAGADANRSKSRIHFEIKAADTVQTDFAQPEPLQRVVRISPKGKFMVWSTLIFQ